MFFVARQLVVDGRTYDHNVRLGGYKHVKSAHAAAVREAPALVRDHARNIVAQTVSPDAPNYIR